MTNPNNPTAKAGSHLSAPDLRHALRRAEEVIAQIPVGQEINFDELLEQIEVQDMTFNLEAQDQSRSFETQILDQQIENNKDSFYEEPIHVVMQEVCKCGHDRYHHWDATDDCGSCRNEPNRCLSFEGRA